MIRVGLANETDWEGWRTATRALVLAGVPASEVNWTVGPGDALPAASGSFGVSRNLVALAQVAIQAHLPGRFALLHRMVAQPDEATVADVRRLALAVRAEAHRMRAELRYLPIGDRYVGWHAPRHFVLEANARLLARRFSHLAVSIVTPEGSAHWQGGEPDFGAGAELCDDAELAAFWRARGCRRQRNCTRTRGRRTVRRSGRWCWHAPRLSNWTGMPPSARPARCATWQDRRRRRCSARGRVTRG